MPGYVLKQRGLVEIPKGPLDEQGTKQLIIQLRKSEIKKNRALNFAINERRLLVKRWAQPASRGWFQSNQTLRWPGDE